MSESHSYHPQTGQRAASYSFGRLLASFDHNPDGTLWRRRDPLDRVTLFTNYKRGLARNVQYQAEGISESASVSDSGQILSVTNAFGTTTGYGYDAMDRLATITPPGETGLIYHPTTIRFERVNVPEYGLPAGHWRQTVSTGDAHTVRYFDARWRPVMTRSFDAAREASTRSVVLRRFDADNRLTFESYAQRDIGSVDELVDGATRSYDALGRPLGVVQHSELGLLTSTISYQAGFERWVTNPRQFTTRYRFQAFDTPSEDAIARIDAPEGITTVIARDVFGKPSSISRAGNGGVPASVERRYVYDNHQRLCKTIEPETQATVQDYDGVSLLMWRASGLNLPDPGRCDRDAVPPERKVSFEYDVRGRPKTTTFGDASPSISRSYTADGLLERSASGDRVWTYQYNNRRLLTREQINVASSQAVFTRGIDRYGNPATLNYNGELFVDHAPNALGQPTQASSGFASNVTWHPNGALAGYTLGNGIVHTTSQNLRGLPETWTDSDINADLYRYDENGNVVEIADLQRSLKGRRMVYDAADRLTSTSGIWGNATYGYDPFDNLRSSTVGGRSLTHGYDSRNRLLSLSGSQNIGLAYDANGNVVQRGGQTFQFDVGNRLSGIVGGPSYFYDAEGRRSLAWFPGSNRIRGHLYSREGLVLGTVDTEQGNAWQVYLGRRLIGEQNTLTGRSYVHTDALGSPVARTNPAKDLTQYTVYEPYGATAAGTGANPTGIGYTGHVNDPESGLVYMQQRYYDQVAGRFLSVDPVTTNANTGRSFGRSHYANNNPYAFVDPNGMDSDLPDAVVRMRAVSDAHSLGQSTVAAATQHIAREASSVIRGGGNALVAAAQQALGILRFTPLGIAVGRMFSEGANSEDKPSLLDPKGEAHVLDGDKTGGGHRPGTSKPGKSEFPMGWSDGRITGEISDVATDPASSRSPGRGGREVVRGTRGGVDIEVIVEQNGRIVTGYPTNLPRNPR